MRLLFWNFAYPRKQLSQRAGLVYASKKLPWALIALGILLRLTQYIANRSLWLDEASLALNIINRSFSELLQPLDYYQGAPIGFLMLTKLAVYTFGNNEYSLRLFPFWAGIISLFFFYGVAKRCLQPKAIPIAVGLFAILDSLIYYSAEVKQYSCDVAIALLLYFVALQIKEKRFTVRGIALFGVVGALAIWVSHPAVFILAGVGASLTLFFLSNRDWNRIGRLSIVFLLWLLSFTLSYFVSLRNLTDNQGLQRFWSDSFMPLPPSSFSDLKWFVRTFFTIFEEPVGLALPGLAAFAFIVGGVSMFLEKKEKFYIIALPIFFALLASAVRKYPFHGRLLLFIVPSVLLFIAEGAAQFIDKTKHHSIMTGATLVGLLFFHSLLSASQHLIEPRTNEELKPVINYVREHRQAGDILYLYYASHHAFEYYSSSHGFNKNDYIVGVASRDNWKNYVEDLNKLRGNKRVWIFFSHVCNWKDVDEEKFFLYHLDNIGTRLDSFKSDGAAVYLYDLSKR